MNSALHELCVELLEPVRLAQFWSEALQWDLPNCGDVDTWLVSDDDIGPQFRFRRSPVDDFGAKLMNIHLTSSSLENQQRSVARLLELGASQPDLDQRSEEGYVVLTDLLGNEFCVSQYGR